MHGALCARAPGKLVILGEYAVLEGAPALVTAVDRWAVVTVRPARDWRIESPELGARAAFGVERGSVVWAPNVPAEERAALALVAACIEEAAGDSAPLALQVSTRELVDATSGAKLGLGSSAAVAAALCGALLARAGVHDARQVFACALVAHRRAQGLGSGVDVAAACFGASLIFHAGPTPRHEKVSLPVVPVCVWTGRAASTRDLVRQVRELARRDAGAYREHMAVLSRIAGEGSAAAAAADASGLVAAVAAYGAALAELGEASNAAIWSQEHRHWRGIVEAAGGVYKPSGAGDGDIGVALARSATEVANLTRALLDAHATVVPLHVAARGLHIENEP